MQYLIPSAAVRAYMEKSNDPGPGSDTFTKYKYQNFKNQISKNDNVKICIVIVLNLKTFICNHVIP